MKTFKYLALYLTFLLLACQEEVRLYDEEINRLSFRFTVLADSTTHYTFVYEPRAKMEDTAWIEVFTTGYVTDYPRPVSIRQLESEPPSAEPNVHYVPFDDPRVASAYVIPAGANSALLPVIVKRDASLSEAEHTLLIGLVENEHFKHGFLDAIKKQVGISDILTKPANWNILIDMIFTPYGIEKHRFMIDATAPLGVIVNEDFISRLTSPSLDAGLINYWNAFFRLKLAEENAQRAALGLGPLREAPAAGQSEGVLITF
jgi:hypothetical protein